MSIVSSVQDEKTMKKKKKMFESGEN